MKQVLEAYAFLAISLVLMAGLIPSFLLDREERREAKRKAQSTPDA